MADRAHGLRAAAWPHVDLDAELWRAKPRLLVDEARKVLTLIEKADQPHATKPQGKRHVAAILPAQGASGDALATYCPDWNSGQ